MQKNLVFHIPTYTDDHSTFPKPVNEEYDYWTPLIKYFLLKSDTIEIHCWNEEIDTFEEIKKLNSFEIYKEDRITILKGMKNSILSMYLSKHHINNIGEFKWFTVNLNKGIVPVFHSGHWGTEFVVTNASEKDIELIKSIIPAKTSFHQY
ncbi:MULTISPECIES: hypothetical protein [unclassified Bacillus (in: firmicutes)]|uniref:hypothetical protein n=1 Tax=unclassified Bacillus (in: firmicutes) TaxID=185979 RepID=UPI000BF019AC|nr:MULTISPECIES: hypothetical protein [unclassified Bacillus (in: firmicutes)]PEJ54365.1 hypothetical protein CN692_19910 [Bacillus sp. AFS002410]PEL06757.1 hypothetical protein CN601_20740 [Bacillus sp. AFS017336]